MDLTGTLLKKLEPVSGAGKNGPWKKQDFIIEIPGDFPKKLCIANWNDKVDLSNYKEGENIHVYFDVESREYNGKWYTDVKVWKLERADASSTTPPPSSQREDPYSAPPNLQAPPLTVEDEVDDLPF
jgi:hypothetical protein